jgi:PmbA protein
MVDSPDEGEFMSAVTAAQHLPLLETVATLEDTATRALELARRAGADAARIGITQAQSSLATVRNHVPGEKSVRAGSEIALTLYSEGRRAVTSLTDSSSAALAKAIDAAIAFAVVTTADPAAGLASTAQFAQDQAVDLDLYHPLDLHPDALMALAQRAEEAAFASSPRIVASNGASYSTTWGVSLLATSNGFHRTVPWSSHAISCAPVAATDRDRQIGFWSDAARASDDLDSPEAIGARAAARACGLLEGRQIPTQHCAILFEPAAALSLLGEFVAAASGDALYRSASFLRERLETPVFADHIRIDEDPFVVRGMASRYHDADGIGGSKRLVVEDGVLRGYFLGLYSARRLGMAPTGNGYGPHNLDVRSTRTAPGDDFAAMLAKLDRGLLVTEMAGGGVNRLTGDFSRAAKGFWVEHGAIQFPVTGVTIASNLDAMFTGLQVIGHDALTRGGVRTGSWLIDAMKIGGV